MGIKDKFYNLIQLVISNILIITGIGGKNELINFYKNKENIDNDFFSSKINDLGKLTLTKFLELNKSEFDAFDDFDEDPNILPSGAVLTYVVSRTDKVHLRQNFLKNRFGKGVIGSSNVGNPLRKIGIFQSIQLNTTLTSIDKSNEGTEYRSLFKTRFMGPRDWVQYNSKLFVLTHPYLLELDRQGNLKKVGLRNLASPHSVFVVKDTGDMLVTSSGNDLLTFFDFAKKKGRILWSAVENGFHYSIGKENIYLTYESKISENLPLGYKVLKVSRYKDLATALQVLHINSAIVSRFGDIFFTAFATKKVGNDTGNRIYQNGSGGKVFKFNKNGEIHDSVVGLSNPHGLIEIETTKTDSFFALTETSKGSFNFYTGDNFKLLKRISFVNAIRRVQNNVKIWLMEVTINYSKDGDIILAAFSDNGTPGIFILKIDKNLKMTRWFVTVPDNWAIQKIVISDI